MDNHRLFYILLGTLTLCLTASPVRGQSNGASGASEEVSSAEEVSPAARAVNFSGDFRLRYENTANVEPGTPLFEARHREVVRFRAGATIQINDLIQFGGRMATGSQDDPNTADVTLGNFVDDLDVSLDRLYIALKHQDLFISGGKFANPFRRTALVWDGDVNPQGVAGSYTFAGSGPISAKFIGMYAIIDEHSGSATPDSDMGGAQVELSMQSASDWSLTLAGGYFNYRISSLSNADAGDTRSNNINSDGTAYISDFNLLDVIAVVDYGGLGYPIRFVGDYVKNLGAEVDEDQGFMLDLFVGRASQTKDVRFRYGYAELETDGVLAAFSNDNTTLATNYVQHTLTLDYVVLDHTTLNVTWYYYRRKDVPAGVDNEYISRLRLNAVVTF